MVQGRRVTDAAAIDATSMVLNGLINTRLLALCRELRHRRRRPERRGRRPGQGAPPRAGHARERRGRGLRHGRRHRRRRRLGDHAAARRRLPAGREPAVLPTRSGQLLNINADTVAAAIGGALVAEKLILCTGAPGILERLDDPHSLISYTDVAGLRRLREEGALSDGMLPKSSAIEAAIRGGVRRVHVISYAAPDALLAEVFTNEGTGTLVVADTKALSRRGAGRGLRT